MNDCFCIGVGLFSPLGTCPAEDILPNHDDEHEHQLEQAGDEEKKCKRVRVEGDDSGQGQSDPTELEKHSEVERPHCADSFRNRCSNTTIQTDVLRLDRGGYQRLPFLHPGVCFRFDQIDALVEDLVLFHQVGVQGEDLAQNRFSVLKSALRTVIGTAPENTLTDKNHEHEHQLHQVAKEQEERVGVGLMHRTNAGKANPDEDENDSDVDGPHRPNLAGEE